MRKKEENVMAIDENFQVVVTIEAVHGQSMYIDEAFEGKYSWISNEVLSKNVATLLSGMMDTEGIFSEFYIGCENEQLKLDVLSEVMRKAKGLVISNKQLCAGSNFGHNVFIDFVKTKEDEQKELTEKRNKLSRQIATLKKANPEQ